jgi:predicted negative regulator of RcsB-dependent stress response
MANHLDLEEQEQLDQIKHFWKQYGNAITWALIVVLGTFASWNAYNYWQRSQAAQVAVLFDELERTVQSGDAARIDRVFADIKDKFGKTMYAQQSALLVARHYASSAKPEQAQAALAWVSESSSDSGYQAIVKLRMAGLLMDAKNLDAAMQQLSGNFPVDFEALVADRKGDVLMLQGKPDQARSDYEKAYRLFDATSPYRRMVEVKLNSLGVDMRNDAKTNAVASR